MSWMEENDVVAVERARNGDSDAFRLLVERHSRAIFRLAFRMTGSEQDAEDVVQETFLRAYKNLGGFEERSHFGTWVHRIAVNCAFDWIRKHRKHEEFSVDVEPEEVLMPTDTGSRSGADKVLFEMDVRRRVELELGKLSVLERSAFVLRHYEGMSIDEIAGALGLQSSAAKQSIFRAVRKMRRALGPLVEAQ
jgi:RNA polymerase sigma-70 factor (ECF subfamily)